MSNSEEIVASKYWHLVRLEAIGKSKVQVIASAKEFFFTQFPQLNQNININHRIIQQQLLEFRDSNSKTLKRNYQMAQICLRCFISSQIEQVCIQLERQFGQEHGFTRYDLFPFVLNDHLDDLLSKGISRVNSSEYQPVSLQILESFDSQKASLSTWTTTIVKHNRELNNFLLEQGVYLISNWAILNDTTIKQVQRILAEFFHLTSLEITQASYLLSSYHTIYRQDRLKQRTQINKKCQPPSIRQLEEIAQLLRQKSNQNFSAESILSQLQKLAELLREYRIYVRSGRLVAHQSLDNDDENINKLQHSALATEIDDSESEQREFSQFYHQQLNLCLKESIALVIQNRLNYLSRKKPPKTQPFLTALELFHCQGKSMGEIAPIVKLKAQYQVTRLLQLKEFRADIRQTMLAKLKDKTVSQASQYVEPNDLKQLEQKIEILLDEQITNIIHTAEIEVNLASNTSPQSLLNRYICRYLKAMKKK